jgi:hypothetical protein
MIVPLRDAPKDLPFSEVTTRVATQWTQRYSPLIGLLIQMAERDTFLSVSTDKGIRGL